jgi:hypothetical protein
MTNQGNHPPSEGDQAAKTQENSSEELSINHFWDICSLFEEKEEAELEEIQASQHSYNTGSKGPIALPNSSPPTSISVPKTNSPKKIVISKTIASDPTISKIDPLVNKSITIDLDFSIVNELKRTRASISLFELGKIV